MEKIKLENEITINTLRKVYKTQDWFQTMLDNASDMNQFLENLDNGYVTREALLIITTRIFSVNNNGGFRNSLDVFGNRSKKRFVKSKLEELL